MNKITNPYLKQMISEISGKTGEGRLVDINWATINESKKPAPLTSSGLGKGGKPKSLVSDKLKEADAKEEAPKDEPKKDELPELPDLGADKPAPDAAPEKAGAKEPAAEKPAEKPAEEPAADAEASGAESEEAKAEADKAKAELEKAKAEKERAEKELKQQSYVKLGSNAGTQFLLSKLLDHAFKTNTIDALAGEMVQKLKIQTPDDMNAFTEDTATFRVLPGMPELLAAMKTMATKQPEAPASEPAAPSLKEMFNRIYPIVPLR